MIFNFQLFKIMQYNTQQKRMPLPEYGRSIQNMVDYALTIQDRAERQRCANTIINIMGNMFPHLRDVPDFKHKLWDHLAIMSGFELDIDYPLRDYPQRQSGDPSGTHTLLYCPYALPSLRSHFGDTDQESHRISRRK